ncbi:MAG: carbamoyl-phosphate synthase large subunit [Thermoplasmata archaeon]|jgi:carbamoyl-phosphate synthase large subunit|nr:carbamoyl-phosphate synthase large subunit [Thermoplasmata archaeon]
MAKREDMKRVMVIGSGPIVIGQAAEFDFSGSQACRSLREEGCHVVLVNSNPATIQTDTETADVVYIEPLTVETVANIIEKESVQGILSGMGGQTALNLCSELAEKGILDRLGVVLLGSQPDAIARSEDRELFRQTMLDIGEPIPRSVTVKSIDEAKAGVEQIGGYPVLVRPAFTLGGTGGGIAKDEDELVHIVGRGLIYSRIRQVLVEESVIGWKEFEYEVMRDSNDNCIIVCNMENMDPMGIHTGESIVVAPAQTLSDGDHQMLRDASLKIIRALGIEGGANVQFAMNPMTGEYRVIEVNPRVSRSSALASKATGYPIARVAAKIALGRTLDEIPNAITKRTCAAFEPTIDYVVVKIPRWPFDKFRTVDRTLGTQMKSTGEVMAIGRNLEEAMLKAVRSLEIDRVGLEPLEWNDEQLMKELAQATDVRMFAMAEALRRGMSVDAVAEATSWDRFFLDKIANIVVAEKELRAHLDADTLRMAKRLGFSDEYIALVTGKEEAEVRSLRLSHGVRPVFKMVDTCAAEFEAETPYYYSSYEEECEARPSDRRKVVIVGGGPIRIGQGIEFDYCCVHGALALKEEGVDAVIINNNPETVSTDFDVSNRLYFEPITTEDVLNVLDKEDADGVILQFGGQTSVNLALPLMRDLAGRRTRILGTSPEAIDLAEDRKKFSELMARLGILQPVSGTGYSFEEVEQLAQDIGYPVLVRPSYVLGGRAMEIVYNASELETYMRSAAKVSPNHPILVDKYLTNAVEIDVDAVCDGKEVYIGGIMEHIEEAGVHSGDATMVLPPRGIPDEVMEEVRSITRKVAMALGTVGLINLQLAYKEGKVFMIEANPRASRTVPIVSKATGVPLAKAATKVMLGKSLKELGLAGEPEVKHYAVKASVFPFLKLPGVDSILGPEMRSTGEVMGIDRSYPAAVWKAFTAAGQRLPRKGNVFVSVCDKDKLVAAGLVMRLAELGFGIFATKGTAAVLRSQGIEARTVYTISEKRSPDVLGLMRGGEVQFIVNTPSETSGARKDGYMMRRLAVELEIPIFTTVKGASAAVMAMEHASRSEITVDHLGSFCGGRRGTDPTSGP